MKRPVSIVAIALVALFLPALVAEAASPVIALGSSVNNGQFISLALGKKYAKKSAIVETGVLVKKKWVYTKVGSAKTDSIGAAMVCSSKLLAAKAQLRVKVGAMVIKTITIKAATQLSGCGYVPPATPTTVAVTDTSLAASGSTAPPATTATTIAVTTSLPQGTTSTSIGTTTTVPASTTTTTTTTSTTTTTTTTSTTTTTTTTTVPVTTTVASTTTTVHSTTTVPVLTTTTVPGLFNA